MDSFGKIIPVTEKRTYIDAIVKNLQLKGKIQMKNPDNIFCIVFDYGHIGEGNPDFIHIV